MGIVVYWQEAPGMPAMEAFAPNQLAQALKFCEAKRHTTHEIDRGEIHFYRKAI